MSDSCLTTARFLVVLLVLLASAQPESGACSCAGTANALESRDGASAAVFTGVVTAKSIEIVWRGKGPPDGEWWQSYLVTSREDVKPWMHAGCYMPPMHGSPVRFCSSFGLKVRFSVFRVWKGEVAEEVEVETAVDGPMCGYSFEIGEQYLVYAGQQPKDQRYKCITEPEAANKRKPCEWELTTSLCSSTSKLDDATDDIEMLGPSVIDHLQLRAQRLARRPHGQAGSERPQLGAEP